MDLFFLPSSSDRFLRQFYSPFEDINHLMRLWGTPFGVYDEDFQSLNSPYHLTRRHVSFLVPKGRYFAKREEKKNEEKSSTENKQENEANEQATSEDKPTTEATPKKEEESLQTKDNYFNALMPLEEIFPNFGNFTSLLQTRADGPFEVSVNLQGCDPDKVKLEVNNGILKVEGKKDSNDRSFTYVRHEQTLPKNVSPGSLKASLLPEGIMKVQQVKRSHNVPITLAPSEEVKPTKITEPEEVDNK